MIPVSLKKVFKKLFGHQKIVSRRGKCFQEELLTSNTTDNVNKSKNSDTLIILLEENIAFLKEQINKKDKKIMILC